MPEVPRNAVRKPKCPPVHISCDLHKTYETESFMEEKGGKFITKTTHGLHVHPCLLGLPALFLTLCQSLEIQSQISHGP